jgi:hypothetical protein
VQKLVTTKKQIYLASNLKTFVADNERYVIKLAVIPNKLEENSNFFVGNNTPKQIDYLQASSDMGTYQGVY